MINPIVYKPNITPIKKWCVGLEVEIINPHEKYEFLRGKTGTIVSIYDYGMDIGIAIDEEIIHNNEVYAKGCVFGSFWLEQLEPLTFKRRIQKIIEESKNV